MCKYPIWILAAATLTFAATPDFTGDWRFSPAKGSNLGMMAMMKIDASIRQTPGKLVVKSVSKFNGTEQTLENRFDLAGKATQNQTPMGAMAETVTHWEAERLVTTWTTEGDTGDVRTETRYLSADGKTMTVESARKNGSTIVMVYERR